MLDPKENTVIAGCRLVNDPLIEQMQTMNIGFVSKLPSSFSDKLREHIVNSAISGIMDDSSIAGYKTYDTESETACGKLRLIAYRSPKGTRKAMDYLERQGKRDADRLFK
ncbi:MAG: hypothetical protein FWD92_01330 [Methanomassiliicoccaceae archaeon]|nr:hypothetical protein [Methanomassiliicoccaceae archaeon]